jgi:transposase-like protein
MSNPRIFRYVKTSPEIIRLAVMMYVRYPLSLRNVEDLLHERGIDITHEGTVKSPNWASPRNARGKRPVFAWPPFGKLTVPRRPL